MGTSHLSSQSALGKDVPSPNKRNTCGIGVNGSSSGPSCWHKGRPAECPLKALLQTSRPACCCSVILAACPLHPPSFLILCGYSPSLAFSYLAEINLASNFPDGAVWLSAIQRGHCSLFPENWPSPRFLIWTEKWLPWCTALEGQSAMQRDNCAPAWGSIYCPDPLIAFAIYCHLPGGINPLHNHSLGRPGAD
jgi:hypothetical protein